MEQHKQKVAEDGLISPFVRRIQALTLDGTEVLAPIGASRAARGRMPVGEEKKPALGASWAGMLLRRLSAFGLVGAAAGLVHFAVGLTLVWTGLLDPFVANICAFLCAFWVSYLGHYRWTFASERQHKIASRRFFVTAAIGFLINQAGVYVLVYQLGLPYPLALVVTFTLVAANTLLLGWLWVF